MSKKASASINVSDASLVDPVEADGKVTPKLSGDESELTATEGLDLAAMFIADRQDKYPPMTEEDEKKILKKIDYILVPSLLFLATLGAVDKVSMSTAAIYGFRTDNHLTTPEYSWLGSIIFIGCLVGMWPMSVALQKFRLGKVLAISSICWSALTLLLCACHNFVGLLIVRFLMGIFECVIVPGCTLVVGRFYLKHEQGVRLAIIFASLSSVINGFLSFLVGHFGDELPKWKYLYIMVGAISFTYGCFMFVFLPDSPMNAKFLNDQQKFYWTKRIVKNSTGVANQEWKWYQVREAFLDPKTYIIFFFNIGINIPNGGLNTFSAIIINNLGFTAMKSSLMSIPTGVISALSSIFFNYLCTRNPNKRSIIGIISLVFPVIGAIILYAVYVTKPTSVGPQLLGLYLLYFYFAPYVIFISLAQANTAGGTKKSAVYSFNYLGYAVGAVCGGKSYDSGFDGGFIAMLVALVFCMAMFVVYWIIVLAQNKQKLAALESDPEGIEPIKSEFASKLAKTEEPIEELLDLTDREQKNFLYTK